MAQLSLMKFANGLAGNPHRRFLERRF